MKLNNKGFAITGVLYGLLILFVILIGSYLTLLGTKKSRLDTVTSDVEEDYEFNEIIENPPQITYPYVALYTGKYIFSDSCYRYLYKGQTYINTDIDCTGNLTKILYNNKHKIITVINNNISYEYDITNHLMEDKHGNKRYFGANPKNYIYFNCSDYSNQSSSTCEMWRIIGTFDGQLKLIRNEQIGIYSWDNKNQSTGAGSEYGKNDWTDARLMKLLNPGYESEVGGSLYYNSGKGNCYAGQNNATKTCDFTSTGIKNDTTRNLISEATYNLGGSYSDSSGNSDISYKLFSDQIYEYERGTKVFSGRPTAWKGKIALAYPSDYGYAADFRYCSGNFDNYNNEGCISNNWMYSIVAPNFGWLLTPINDWAYSSWRVNKRGDAGYDTCMESLGVTPVLYLNKNVEIKSGNGTSTNPYQLSA